jgi:uncharacterized protein (UPF0262 family)
MSSSLSEIHLHYPNGQSPSRLVRDCDMALADLRLASRFQPTNDKNGPYRLDISVESHRLVLKIKNSLSTDLPMLILSLSPYRRLIHDYFLMIESYEQVRIEGNLQKLEPIDMARRGLHNEAADMMRERLRDRIDIDHDTARRLFTLVCALTVK